MNVRIGYWSLEYGELSTEQPIHSFTVISRPLLCTVLAFLYRRLEGSVFSDILVEIDTLHFRPSSEQILCAPHFAFFNFHLTARFDSRRQDPT
jgi:hypothetical protein